MKFTILNNLSRWGLTALLSVSSFSGVAVAELGPDPSSVRINGISYAGSGCPAGSVSQNLSEDAKAFTLLFDS